MPKSFLFFSFFAIMFSACDKNKNTPLLTLDDLQGEWLEIESGVAYAGTNHHFVFEGEDAYLTLKRWTDAIIFGDPCPGNRIDYVVGTISLSSDNFTFLGSFADESFLEIAPNCDSIPGYELNLDYTYEDGILILNPGGSEYEQIRLEQQD